MRRKALPSLGSLAVTGVAQFSKQSIVWLVRAGDQGHPTLVAQFGGLRTYFPDASVHVLIREIGLPLRLAMLAARRRMAPYDMLIRIDLESPLTPRQIGALEHLKKDVGGKVFLTHNVQFHKRAVGESDVAMAFINTWPMHRTPAEAQDYWLHHHGPLVVSVGLPSVITSYTQVHFDSTAARPMVFDNTYQGLSFETIRSQSALVRTFTASPALRRLNRVLLKDEKEFSGPPLFFCFRHAA